MAEDTVVQVDVMEVPAKMEFRLINPTEQGFPKRIDWNKDELETAVRAKVAEYTGIVYTEETVKSAKKDRAELNALFKAIEDRRKKVKSILNQPYAQFEAEVKEVTSLITNQSALIGKQIEEFETRQKEEKKAKLRGAYDEEIGDLASVLPFEKVFDLRYLNQTFKVETAISEIQDTIRKVKNDLATIESVCVKHTINAKDIYLRSLNLSMAFAEEKRLNDLEERLEAERIRKEREAEERRKAEEERKAAQAARKAEEEAKRAEAEHRAAEERMAEQERRRAEETAQKAEEKAARKEAEHLENAMNHPVDATEKVEGDMPFADRKTAEDEVAPAVEPEKKVRARFYAIGTMAQLKALTQYMKDNGIRYGKVE